MTKKIILACMLSFGCIVACFLGGCEQPPPSPPDFCYITGPPNAPFIVLYADGSSIRGAFGSNGSGILILISPLGHRYTCGQPTVLFGTNSGLSLSAAPCTVDLNALPSSVTITGQAIDGTYGMPLVEYFDSNGYLVGSTSATAVASDGSWLTAPPSNLWSVYSGIYQVRVTNRRSDGWYLNIVGTATMNCYGRDRADSDLDGYYDDEDCYPYDSSRWSCGDPGGGGGCNPTNGDLPAMECPVY